MSERSTLKNSVPPEVGELWAQLHAEAMENCATLRAQAGGISLRKVLAIGVPLALLLAVVMIGGLWSAGVVSIPAFACDVANGLCTPTPTLNPTATTQPTYTPYPTNTPLPPTLTPTPPNTPTPTSTPLPLGDLLAGCTINTQEGEPADFDFGVYQESPVDVVRTVRALKPVEGLKTTVVISNTGQCRLIEAGVLQGLEVIAKSPEILLNAGQTFTFDYAWPPLEEGQHTAPLMLQFRTPDGAPYNLPGREFVLALNLTLQLDSDGDGVADEEDCCPQTSGVAALSGCPDGDSDGFVDQNDKACRTLQADLCHDAAQVAAGHDGCPDSDGDGVLDKDDCCPSNSGTLRGCPDGDADGFPDAGSICPDLPNDNCPDKSCGQNGGCPNCRTEYDKCSVEVCEDKYNAETSQIEKDCRTEYHDCTPHEVCTCP